MMVIERAYFDPQYPTENRVETVGMVYLTDLMYILKQVNFHELLKEPVIKFVGILVLGIPFSTTIFFAGNNQILATSKT